jgi:hypothetical protein
MGCTRGVRIGDKAGDAKGFKIVYRQASDSSLISGSRALGVSDQTPLRHRRCGIVLRSRVLSLPEISHQAWQFFSNARESCTSRKYSYNFACMRRSRQMYFGRLQMFHKCAGIARSSSDIRWTLQAGMPITMKSDFQHVRCQPAPLRYLRLPERPKCKDAA